MTHNIPSPSGSGEESFHPLYIGAAVMTTAPATTALTKSTGFHPLYIGAAVMTLMIMRGSNGEAGFHPLYIGGGGDDTHDHAGVPTERLVSIPSTSGRR